ncbi:Uma2 family endonuclease [Streptomyces californicus]|uniref:Uma2 family endonuclease n=1 Tax=Streptomyces californicus TaxID=67351 RepID=UPI0033C40D9E
MLEQVRGGGLRKSVGHAPNPRAPASRTRLRHGRGGKVQAGLARTLANALDAVAGPDWNADTDFDVRLQDVPLTNRRPDVTVYRAETIDLPPTRPEHVLLVVEVVSPGSETTDRIVKVDQYAKAGIPCYWRIEQAATGVPIVYTHVLDPATKAHRDGEMFTGTVKATAPFSITVDLGVM